jgi:hypothetical protein
MSPWGYTDALPADYADQVSSPPTPPPPHPTLTMYAVVYPCVQNALSAAAVKAIKSSSGLDYGYGPIATTIYPASGSSADYTYGVCGVKYSYGVELRDTGKYGFLLPPDQIVPSGQEIYAAVVAMGQYIVAHP